MTLEDPPKPRRNPRPVPPDRDPSLHPLARPSSSLVESLGDVVDDARQIVTDLGLRPYRVFSVVVRWSGGEVGKGDPCVESEVELLPTPKVVFFGEVGVGGLTTKMTEGGLSERGDAKMMEISPRYTEDDVRQLFHLQPLPAGLDGFVEVRMDARDGSSIRRRFAVLVPQRRAEKFDWIVRLKRQNQNDRRDSSVDNVKSPLEVEQLRRRERGGRW